MPGFDKNEFWCKILSMYPEMGDTNYVIKLNEEQIREIKALFINEYIPFEKLGFYDEEQIFRKMLTAMVSIYYMDKDTVTNRGEVVELVDSVNYDGKFLYIHFAKISPAKMRRLLLGKTQKQVAESSGLSIHTIRNCEAYFCDLNRQPYDLVKKIAKALECEVTDIMI
ncbi:MAG: helix-turn-helix transcriptional regulator [Lachnospiraceae bacterium]|nr:helix-turn-helix transcriptional regulator [Lachnospiraceae bacterium]